MAERVDASHPVNAPGPVALPRARVLAGTRLISRLLRTGAIVSGLCFLASLVLEAVPQSETQAYAIDALRKGGMVLLMATPLVRLVASGVLLGLKGEYRYAMYAAFILLLLAVAVGAGMSA